MTNAGESLLLKSRSEFQIPVGSRSIFRFSCNLLHSLLFAGRNVRRAGPKEAAVGDTRRRRLTAAESRLPKAASARNGLASPRLASLASHSSNTGRVRRRGEQILINSYFILFVFSSFLTETKRVRVTIRTT